MSILESRVDLESETDKYRDYRFTKWMTKNVGLQGIPTSAFYSEPHKHLAENYVRYCFIKVSFNGKILSSEYNELFLQKDENLQKAADILKKWKGA